MGLYLLYILHIYIFKEPFLKSQLNQKNGRVNKPYSHRMFSLNLSGHLVMLCPSAKQWSALRITTSHNYTFFFVRFFFLFFCSFSKTRGPNEL